jgi:prepilin-type N-terminal cleavage/methylation domain-containing protein
VSKSSLRLRTFEHRLARLSRGEGFSLTEVLMASVLLLVVLAAVYGIWFGMQRTYSFTDEDMTAQAEARSAMNEMVELIRTARQPEFAVAQSLDLVIVRAEPNVLICWSDVDRDANHDLELVRFRVDPVNRTLYRDTCQTADPTFASATQTRLVGTWVSNNDTAGNELFSYVGMNGAPLAYTAGAPGDPAHIADPDQIREVHINLFVDVIVGKSPEHHVLSSVVQPRNLRSY